jgi:rod shape-determining protein MreC
MISSITRFIKNRQLLPVIVIFFVCLLLILTPEKIKVSIAGLITGYIYYPFNILDDFLNDISSAKKENVELNRKLANYSIKAAQFTEDHYENIRLRRMLGFDLQLPYMLIPAEVIGLRPGLMAKNTVINAGENKGIKRNMPVVSADGVVGKIIEVAENTAVVQLLVDHNCKVSAIDQNTRAMGIIRWHGGKHLEMGDVPIESEIAMGDTIVCSGLGGIFPPGLVIGNVVFTQDREGTLFKEVVVMPSVDFGSLEEVFVVIYGK